MTGQSAFFDHPEDLPPNGHPEAFLVYDGYPAFLALKGQAPKEPFRVNRDCLNFSPKSIRKYEHVC